MRVFVVGGYAPNGGTHMAYQIGRILHEDFGLETIVVNVGDKYKSPSDRFHYPVHFDSIPFENLNATATSKDLLVVNPSFSKHLFGLNCLGKKLMYAQGFNTFNIIDGFFDHYVSVSSFVADFLHTTYRLDSPVIPSCIWLQDLPSTISWDQKLDLILVPILKEQPLLKALLEQFCRRYERQFSNIRERLVIIDQPIPNKELKDLLMRHRYLLSLSPAEGFGLIPLEAMACGSSVIGFDGMGGTEYMRDGENCAVERYPNLDGLVNKAHQVLSDSVMAKTMAEKGMEAAKKYDFQVFRNSWVEFLTPLVK